MKSFISLIISFCIFVVSAFSQTTPRPNTSVVPPTPTSKVTMGTAVTSSAVAVNQLPSQIQALGSEEELFSYSLSTAKNVYVWLWSQAGVGDAPYAQMTISGSGSLPAIQKLITQQSIAMKMSSIDWISYYVRVVDTGGSLSISGGDAKKPVAKAIGGYETLGFNIQLSLEPEVLILWKNLRSIKMTTFDDANRISQTVHLPVDANGFRFPTNAAGKVLVEVTDINGVINVYDLRKSATASVDTVATMATISGRNLISATDKAEINIIPESIGGVGENILLELVLTKVTAVSVAGRTIEGKNCTAFKYRQTDNLSDSGWKTPVPASVNGLATLQLGAGTWHIIAIFPESALRPPTYTYVSLGGKR